ncbi:hypothetical protein NY78_0255 [Desulfovibrio sp. TomC]|nr:hypothetical protein NY78_0255 [Desulfovibrio sp. TomC]
MKARQTGCRRAFHAYTGWMNDFLIFSGVLVAWFLVVRFIFPKLGIQG